MRGYQVCALAGQKSFADESLLVLGLFSVWIAAIFIHGQTDYKHLLAYSSIENLGIVAIGIALGGPGVYGGLYHALNHSLIKALSFSWLRATCSCFMDRSM